MINKELIRGALKPIILSVLKENDRLYGYEINKMVAQITDKNIQLTDGALYPMLHKLEKDGLLKTELVNVDNRLRKYYSLTTSGESESAKRVNELLEFIKSVTLLVKPQTT